MIYGRNKIIEYPNKSILEDVLTRDGLADDNCFTPFNGCAHILREQFPNNKDDYVTVMDILSCSKEFSVHKARATDDGVTREAVAREIDDYHTDLENIDSAFVEKYVKDAIIGYKLNATGHKAQKKIVEINNKCLDSETGEYVDYSDIEPEEQSFSVEEVIEAKSKLPYLLKQLHDGSVMYGGSLLSFIIAAEKFFKDNISNTEKELRPRHLVQYGVWKMSRNGELTTKFVIGDNTGDTFRNLVSWICGSDKNNIYYKAYCELLKVLTVLNLDITEEDARNYSGKYIKKIVCTYIASNKEYLESYGFHDKKILSMLSPDKLFEIAKRIEDEDDEPSQISICMLADNIATNIEKFKFTRSKIWKDKPRAVNEFLAFISKRDGYESQLTIMDFDIYKGILKKSDGNYFLVNITDISPNGNQSAYALVTTSGYLILFERFDITLRVIDIYDALRLLKKEGYRSDEWKYINV